MLGICNTVFVMRKTNCSGIYLELLLRLSMCMSVARAALLTGRLPIRNGFYTTNAHARNGLCVPFAKFRAFIVS